MLEVHEKIGIPLKAVWMGVNTDKNIVNKLEKTEDEELEYKFLGTKWILYENKTSPLPYLLMGQKTRGESQYMKLEETS